MRSGSSPGSLSTSPRSSVTTDKAGIRDSRSACGSIASKRLADDAEPSVFKAVPFTQQVGPKPQWLAYGAPHARPPGIPAYMGAALLNCLPASRHMAILGPMRSAARNGSVNNGSACVAGASAAAQRPRRELM